VERNNSSDRFPIGSKLPGFSLPDVSGRNINDHYLQGAKAALVVFTCNHCPYVKGSEAALIQLVRHFDSLGLKTLTINSNDASKYPEDSFDNMKAKAKALNLPYPYLYDESQKVARAFDAACTPECYLFDSTLKLVFHGTINENPKESSVAKKNFLWNAVDQLLKGQSPDPAFVHPIGCSIKWR
jgi:peroxiredoxin